METFKTATARHSALKSEAERLEAEIAALKDEEKQCREKLAKLFEGDVEEEFAQRRPGADRPARGADADDDAGIPAAGDRPQDRPALGVDHRVVPVPVAEAIAGRADPDRPGDVCHHPVRQRGAGAAKERLSEGEKQIFAISVLWGLARASDRPLPAVIDTPMARLDATHRRNLVERYFPNASHQVVIFSTDTEVDRDYYRPCSRTSPGPTTSATTKPSA